MRSGKTAGGTSACAAASRSVGGRHKRNTEPLDCTQCCRTLRKNRSCQRKPTRALTTAYGHSGLNSKTIFTLGRPLAKDAAMHVLLLCAPRPAGLPHVPGGMAWRQPGAGVGPQGRKHIGNKQNAGGHAQGVQGHAGRPGLVGGRMEPCTGSRAHRVPPPPRCSSSSSSVPGDPPAARSADVGWHHVGGGMEQIKLAR